MHKLSVVYLALDVSTWTVCWTRKHGAIYYKTQGSSLDFDRSWKCCPLINRTPRDARKELHGRKIRAVDGDRTRVVAVAGTLPLDHWAPLYRLILRNMSLVLPVTCSITYSVISPNIFATFQTTWICYLGVSDIFWNTFTIGSCIPSMQCW